MRGSPASVSVDTFSKPMSAMSCALGARIETGSERSPPRTLAVGGGAAGAVLDVESVACACDDRATPRRRSATSQRDPAPRAARRNVHGIKGDLRPCKGTPSLAQSNPTDPREQPGAAPTPPLAASPSLVRASIDARCSRGSIVRPLPVRIRAMKHFVPLTLAALLAMSALACDQTESTTSSSGTTTSTSAKTETTTPAPATSTTPAPVGQEVTMPNGLKYTDVKVGDGDIAESGMMASVHYTGWLTD